MSRDPRRPSPKARVRADLGLAVLLVLGAMACFVLELALAGGPHGKPRAAGRRPARQPATSPQ